MTKQPTPDQLAETVRQSLWNHNAVNPHDAEAALAELVHRLTQTQQERDEAEQRRAQLSEAITEWRDQADRDAATISRLAAERDRLVRRWLKPRNKHERRR